MSNGVNKVILIGNLGSDPEARNAASGSVIIALNIATKDTWKDKQTGLLHERTEWHKVVIFNRLAEIAKQYLIKGSNVYIEGSLRTRIWQDQSGNDRYSTEIVGSKLQVLDIRTPQKNPHEPTIQEPPQRKKITTSDPLDDFEIPF